MTKDARRAQLLDVAHEIIKRDGTDALTLARLAEHAGVSKPIAYDHFGTRPALLGALFRMFDAQQVERMAADMAVGGDTLQAATRIAAGGYLNCLVGPEYEDLCAALLAYEETKDYLRDSRTYFADAYRDAFAPFVTLDSARGRAVLSGLVGAAEALAREMHDATVDDETAIDALAAMLLAALTPFVASPDDAGLRAAHRLATDTAAEADRLQPEDRGGSPPSRSLPTSGLAIPSQQRTP